MAILKRHLASGSAGKILVCSSSNAAVDKLCEQAMKTFPPQDGRELVVRTGDEARFGASIKSVTLGHLSKLKSGSAAAAAVETEIGAAVDDFKGGKIDEPSFESLVARLNAQLKEVKRHRAAEEHRRFDILDKASFVFSTLGSAGGERLRSHRGFELVIVQAANAANEATSLLALQHANRAVLFGDEHQLQPLVSDASRWLGYQRSLFERLVENDYPSVLLDVQNTHHPLIYRHASHEVYGGAVVDGDDDRVRAVGPWQTSAPVWMPSTFVNVKGSTEVGDGTSFCNPKEVNAVIDVLKALLVSSVQDPVTASCGLRIGVTSPYGAQAKALEAAVKSLAAPEFVTVK